MPAKPDIKNWVIDLDNTLYSPHSNVFPQIHARMDEYIQRHFGGTREKAGEIRKNYFYKYGTSLRGLMVEEKIAPDAFLDFVHDVDLSSVQPRPDLKAALQKQPGRKVIFTNADRRHAARILEKLDLADVFESVFDIEDGAYICKPQHDAYQALLHRFGMQASESLLADDMEANLKPAHELGFKTLWVRHEAEWLRHKPGPAHAYPHCHYVADDLLHFLHQHFPE